MIVLCAVMVLGANVARAQYEAPKEEPKAEEPKPTATFYVDFLNQYVWRGYALSDAQKGMVIQPSATLSYRGFSLNVWGNFDTADRNPVEPEMGAAWNETDITLSYTYELVKNLNASVGMIYYALDKVDDSFEVYAGLAYTFPWLTVGVTGYREISHYPGWWVTLDLSKNIKLPCYDWSVDLGATFIYQDSDDRLAYSSPPKFDPLQEAYSNFHSGILSAAVNFPIGKYFTISPKVGYSFPLSGEADDEIEFLSWDHDSNHVWGGLRVTASF
ncbi:MAG: hypothetical protein AB9873_16905 [Syntrophobacteraceae bacterium]